MSGDNQTARHFPNSNLQSVNQLTAFKDSLYN